MQALKRWIQSRSAWTKFRETQREGWGPAWRRYRVQRRIDATPPVSTDREGPVEIRVLSWRRDWRNVTWALKSFYHFSKKRFPLYIHDGGLEDWQAERLQQHFPDAHILRVKETEARVDAELTRRGLARSRAYRQLNIAMKKVFDFFLFSTAQVVLSIDSDIVFFREPTELVCDPPPAKNLYNRDENYAYSMTLEELKAAFGIEPPPRINSGLSLVHTRSMDYEKIEGWLQNQTLFDNKWVTEQTLHALCSTLHGVDFLPPTYHVGTEPGMPEGVVCKHYPGFYRPLLYSEGMTKLIEMGFVS